MKIPNIFIAIASFLFAVATANAVPAYPGLLKITQPDGSVLTYRIVGDERFHAFTTTDGHMIKADANGVMRYVESISEDGTPVMGMIAHNPDMRQAAEVERLKAIGTADFNKAYNENVMRKAPMQRLPGPTFPTTGNLKGVILLVEFADNSMQEGHDSKLFHSVMNEEGFSLNGATGSARDYFISQSMGKFTPDFDVFGPIKLKKSMMYYGANDSYGQDSKPGLMVKEACEYASDELGVDFTKYDYNDDGIVDFVYVIYAGYAESYGASSNTIWPHASNLVSLGISCNVNGKQVQRYACSSELKYVSGTQLEGIGTFCHEFSHVLGLPDAYNTRNQQMVQLGVWDVMDTGNYNNESHTPPAYSAFERFTVGWLDFVELDTPADLVTLDELTQNNVAYKISTADENEFFTLENRQQKGWDAYLPGRGLMIFHVAYDQSAWDGNYVNSGTIQRYDLVEADGTQGITTESDLYPIATNNMFTDYSSPSSLSWDGTPTEKGVTNITDNNGVISFSFMKDRLKRPVAEEASDITSSSFVANWQEVEEAESYRLNLREILPDSINPVITDEDFSLMTSGEYPKSDITDIGEDLDSYMAQQGWYGSKIYQSGGYMQVGFYGQNGMLRSPVFEFADCDGYATMAFNAVSYPGKTVSYTISLTDPDTQATIQKHSLKANKTESEVVIYFKNVPQKAYFIIETNKERAYFNDLRILKDSIGKDNVWNAGPQEWSVDSISGTSYMVDGLTANRTYIYNVQALSAEELKSSLPSADIQVTTTIGTGIKNFESSATRKIASVSFYDLSGRKISGTAKGIIIQRITYDDGYAEARKLIIP